MNDTKLSEGNVDLIPPQHQDHQPGIESEMEPLPISEPKPMTSGKLEGKIALITGGDSGIGRATALAFAEEGADVAIAYYDEHADAEQTQRQIESRGRKCLLIPGDLGDEGHAQRVVDQVVREFGRIDTLVNNAAEQHPQDSIEKISADQLERVFRTNVFAYFYLIKAAIPHLPEGASIINTTSVTAYRGSPGLLDYSATKGAIVAMTRSLSNALVSRKIRVNAVAPGPIWTPLIPSTFGAEDVGSFGQDTPMRRPGQPSEVAPCFVFLASDDASYMSGQTLHPNGGEIVNG